MLRRLQIVPPKASRIRRRARGFTLMELMVAVIAGMLVAAAAFTFSKQSTRFFAQEARIASAQMSVLAGFERLQADIARAAYMSTPNMRRDHDLGRVCAPDYALWAPALQTLTGLMVTVGGSNTGVPALPDGSHPDSIRIAGNLASSEMFPVRTIEAVGTGHNVYLQVNNGPMTRAGMIPGQDNDSAIAAVFRPGSAIRILDQHGKTEFEVISATSYPVAGQPVISTRGALPLKGDITAGQATTAACGIDGLAVGVQANPVNIVDYGIASLRGSGSVYDSTIYSDAGYALGDETRTELVRRELNLLLEAPPAFASDPNAEIVAEYAVDLRVGLHAPTLGSPGLTYFPPGSGNIATRMALASTYADTDPVIGPESVRAVELRLVVRSREVDRASDTDPSAGVLDGGFMFRYPMPNGGFARARTLVADVALTNQRGDAW